MRNFSEGSRYASIATMFRPPSRIITQTKSVKIIKDRDEKPKGFGYIEFAELDGLKDALTKSGTVSLSAISSCMFNRPPNQSFAGRTIRVSVAEPRKSRHVYSVVMHLRISSQQKNEPGSGDLEGSMMRNLLVTGGAMGLYPIRLLREMLHADASMVLDQYGSLPLLRFPTTHPTGALLVLPGPRPLSPTLAVRRSKDVPLTGKTLLLVLQILKRPGQLAASSSRAPLPSLLPPPADLAVDEEIWVLLAMHPARLKKATGEGDPSLVIAHHVS